MSQSPWRSAGSAALPLILAMMATFDPRIPSIARVYDYLLGGKDNFAADREVAVKLLAVYPPIIETVPESRRFVARAVSWAAAEQGITRFIDLGTGLPTAPDTHETAQTVSPAAVIAYVDNDPVVISHLTALLARHNDRVAVISGDLRDRDAILDDPGLRALIDPSKPVCVETRPEQLSIGIYPGNRPRR